MRQFEHTQEFKAFLAVLLHANSEMNGNVAAGRRNPVKIAGHRSWVSDDSRNRPLATHG